MTAKPMKQTRIDCKAKDREQYTPKWLNTQQAANYLGLTEKALLNLVSLGRIPYYKLGRANRYSAAELDELVMMNPKGLRNGNKTN